MTMKNAIYAGWPEHLDLAYPEDVKAVIGRMVRIMPHAPLRAGGTPDREVLSEVEVILSTWGMPCLNADFLAAAAKLEAVFYAAGSVKGFFSETAVERGLVVCSAADANGIPVAEYTLGVALLALKSFWRYQRQPAEARFGVRDLLPSAIHTGIVGLVSLGVIGRRVAKSLVSHGITVLAHDPWVAPDAARECGVTTTSLEDVFARGEVVSIHTPWLPETEKMIGAPLLRSMPPGATFINTSRGAVVDEEALVEVLRERPDLTAVLDVTHPEPPAPDSPLRTLPNVILTPHIAGSTGREIGRMGRWMCEDLQRYLRGEELLHRVDPAKLRLMA